VSDPYEVLGLRPKASSFAVQRAYRRLVRIYPPERIATDPQAAKEFQLIAAAYHRIKETNWHLPGRKGERLEPIDEAVTGNIRPELPTVWSDGTPIYYPTAEETETLLRGGSLPSQRRTILRVLLGTMMLLSAYIALGGDPHGVRCTPPGYLKGFRRVPSH
jgi:hypothetical protein